MQSLSLQPTADKNASRDLAEELAALEALLSERRRELAALQEEFREFKQRYTRTVGSRLAELAEVERAIKEAEERSLGIEAEAEEDAETFDNDSANNQTTSVRTSLRKLFWSVAKMFHPDHAADESEARRRHSIMAEASRAYREGDVESLHTLLGDEQLQSYCAAGHEDEDTADLAGRLLSIKEELRTIEFGIKRIKQHGLYRQKLMVDEEIGRGRDLLAQEAERINRQIIKARRRLAHLS